MKKASIASVIKLNATMTYQRSPVHVCGVYSHGRTFPHWKAIENSEKAVQASTPTLATRHIFRIDGFSDILLTSQTTDNFAKVMGMIERISLAYMS